ncbi:LEA-2 domain-containing protein [Favolaschia claudopus]|uniref:LEA-2 domain-containing protein n=1 Tax=Favolaschia claudopus TaxID=2862362 RepID=A0AAW0B3Z8_9AGAR
MAYRDPYAGQYGHYQQPSYGQPQYGDQYQQQHGQQYGNYGDPAPEFNPYAAQDQPHPTYEAGAYENYGGGYRDDPGHNDRAPQRQGSQLAAGYSDTPPGPSQLTLKNVDERSSFDPGEFTPHATGPKTAGNLRQYRRDFQGPLWTRGSRGSCIGRFFCCTLLIAVFIILTIFLGLILFLRPPSITFGDVTPMSSGVQLTQDGININMGVNISVHNPNFFSVNLKKVNAQIFYPINNTLVGGGTAHDVSFPSNTETNFTFPFAIDYSTSIDPRNLILLDLAEKCGILGTKSDLTVKYKITIGVQILFVTVSPAINNQFTFGCPLKASDLQGLLGSAGMGTPTTSRRDALPDL